MHIYIYIVQNYITDAPRAYIYIYIYMHLLVEIINIKWVPVFRTLKMEAVSSFDA